jgi:hypothetical protein
VNRNELEMIASEHAPNVFDLLFGDRQEEFQETWDEIHNTTMDEESE